MNVRSAFIAAWCPAGWHLTALLVALAVFFSLSPGTAFGASFVVDTTADDPGIALQGCSGSAGDCSLRGAITRANLSTQADVITFGLSGTISTASALPALTGGGDTIDGSASSVLIQGAEARTFPCVLVSSAGNTVKGLSITDCSDAIELSDAASDNNTLGPGITLFDNYNGIYIGSASANGNIIIGNKLGTNSAGTAIPPEGANFASAIAIVGSNNTVGGATTAERNIISGNGGGVWLRSGATGNTLYGNFIGTDVTGTVDLGNVDTGVEVNNGSSNTIGGLLAGQGNLISGNDTSNVYLYQAANNTVQGNIIGPTINGGGTLTNGDGVDITSGSSGNTIGPGNVISDNIDGIFIASTGTSGNVIKGNLIGTNPAGTAALQNSAAGIDIGFSAGPNTIGGVNPGDGNIIAFNATAGVLVAGASTLGNTIRGNSIHDNGSFGIANVNGGNGGLAPPVIAAVGSASGTACANCFIDVYSDDADEGRLWEGSVYADGAGSWSYFGPVSGPNITATATDAFGSTSQFSTAFGCGDFDGDSINNCADADDDNDGYTDDAEAGILLCKNNVNDDSFEGETLYFVNDGCPTIGIPETNCGGALDNDLDGYPNDGCPKDGSYSEAQFRIGTGSLDPCGNNGWPADVFSSGGSANKLDLQDLASFVSPAPRRLGTNPGEAGFSSRWDLIPGAAAGKFINLQDLAASAPSNTSATARPPMLGGTAAFGQVCPFPP